MRGLVAFALTTPLLVSHAAADGEPVGHLRGHGGLDVDALDLGVVAEEAAHRVAGPLGGEAVRREEADARREPVADPGGEVGMRDGIGLRLVLLLLARGGVGEAAARHDEGHARRGGLPAAQVEPRRREARGVVEDRRAVGAGRGDADAGATHRAGAMLVHAVALRRGRAGRQHRRARDRRSQTILEASHRPLRRDGTARGMAGRPPGGRTLQPTSARGGLSSEAPASGGLHRGFMPPPGGAAPAGPR